MASPSRLVTIGIWATGLLMLFCAFSIALGRLFWFDEISTHVVAAQPSAAGVLRALAAGTDSLPPLFFLLTHAALQLPIDPHVALRLPALAGCALLVPMVVRIGLLLTGSRAAAWFGLLFFAVNGARSYYAEGRPYGISLGVMSLALWAWLRCSQPDAALRHRLLLFFSLAVLPSLHYYNGLFFLPFALAELVHLFSTRRFRLPLWGGLLSGTLLLLPNLKYIAAFKAAFGNNFWAKATFSAIPTWFEELYKIRGDFAIGLHCGLFLLLAWQLYLQLRPGAPTVSPTPVQHAFTRERCVWALTAMTLPAVAFLAAKVLQGGMTGRYFLFTLFGSLMGLLFFVGQLPLAHRAIAILAAAPVLLAQSTLGFAPWRQGNPVASRTADLAREWSFLNTPDFKGQTILVSSGHAYTIAAHYLNPTLRPKLSILIDPPSAVKYLGTDSVDQAIRLLAVQANWQTETLESLRRLPVGALVIAGSGFTWNVNYFTDHGFGLQPVGLTTQGQVFRITSKPAN